jgi:hypothetical protein
LDRYKAPSAASFGTSSPTGWPSVSLTFLKPLDGLIPLQPQLLDVALDEPAYPLFRLDVRRRPLRSLLRRFFWM